MSQDGLPHASIQVRVTEEKCNYSSNDAQVWQETIIQGQDGRSWKTHYSPRERQSFQNLPPDVSSHYCSPHEGAAGEADLGLRNVFYDCQHGAEPQTRPWRSNSLIQTNQDLRICDEKHSRSHSLTPLQAQPVRMETLQLPGRRCSINSDSSALSTASSLSDVWATTENVDRRPSPQLYQQVTAHRGMKTWGSGSELSWNVIKDGEEGRLSAPMKDISEYSQLDEGCCVSESRLSIDPIWTSDTLGIEQNLRRSSTISDYECRSSGIESDVEHRRYSEDSSRKSGSFTPDRRRSSALSWDFDRSLSYASDERREGGLLDGRRGSSLSEGRRGSSLSEGRRGSSMSDSRWSWAPSDDRRGSHLSDDRRGSYLSDDRRSSYLSDDRRGSHLWDDRRGSFLPDERGCAHFSDDRRGSYLLEERSGRCMTDERRGSSLPDGTRHQERRDCCMEEDYRFSGAPGSRDIQDSGADLTLQDLVEGGGETGQILQTYGGTLPKVCLTQDDSCLCCQTGTATASSCHPTTESTSVCKAVCCSSASWQQQGGKQPGKPGSCFAARPSTNLSAVSLGSQDTSKPGMKNLQDWLKTLRLHKYSQHLENLTYDQLLNLSESELEEKNITKGARRKILTSIQKLKDRPATLHSINLTLEKGDCDIRKIIAELEILLKSPLPVDPDPGEGTDRRVEPSEEKSATEPTASETQSSTEASAVTEKSAAATEENLADLICLTLRRVCTNLLLSPTAESGNVTKFVSLLDICIGCEPFSQTQKQLFSSWKLKIRNIWQPALLRRSSLQYSKRHSIFSSCTSTQTLGRRFSLQNRNQVILRGHNRDQLVRSQTGILSSGNIRSHIVRSHTAVFQPGTQNIRGSSDGLVHWVPLDGGGGRPPVGLSESSGMSRILEHCSTKYPTEAAILNPVEDHPPPPHPPPGDHMASGGGRFDLRRMDSGVMFQLPLHGSDLIKQEQNLDARLKVPVHGSVLSGTSPVMAGAGPVLASTGPVLAGTSPVLPGTGPVLSVTGPASSGSVQTIQSFQPSATGRLTQQTESSNAGRKPVYAVKVYSPPDQTINNPDCVYAAAARAGPVLPPTSSQSKESGRQLAVAAVTHVEPESKIDNDLESICLSVTRHALE